MTTNHLAHELWRVTCLVWDGARCLFALGLGYTVDAGQWIWRKLGQAERWLIRVSGPVYDSIQGEINREEAKRVFTKAVVGFVTGEIVEAHKLVTDPDVLSAVIAPTLVGLVCGVLAYIHHKGDGKPPEPGTQEKPA